MKGLANTIVYMKGHYINIYLPMVILVKNYRGVDTKVEAVRDTLNQVLGKKVKIVEIFGNEYPKVRYTYDSYAFLVYIGKKPSKEEITELFLQAAKKAGYKS